MAIRKSSKKTTIKKRGEQVIASKRASASVTQTDLPYLISNKRVPELLQKIQSAAVPPRVTVEFLRKLGFNSSNDRAFPSLLKKIGFVDASGVPTKRYRDFKNPAHSPYALGEGVKEAYQELFSANEKIATANSEQLKGTIASVSGAADRYVTLIAATFRSLAAYAKFDQEASESPSGIENDDADDVGHEDMSQNQQGQRIPRLPVAASGVNFRYNIEIHLPATSDVGVYNAIFRSLREHLVD